MKPKILFVDDEQNILDSLRLSLRSRRNEWEMTFALGGLEALAELGRFSYDVVVSDMRMPGMDGIQLLKKIQDERPQMARIILSGYSDKEGVLRNICLAHQYLGKPCRTSELEQAIRKALRLHGILADEKLKSTIARIDTLPALPAAYNELVAALNEDDVSLKHIGSILAKDVALCALVLRVVNSPFFCMSSRVTNIHHGVMLLGVQTLRTLVLSAHLFTTLNEFADGNFSVQMLWDHSIRVAGFARRIGELEGLSGVNLDDCAIAGMLHDIGKLVLGTKLPEEYGRVLSIVRQRNCPLHVAENEIFGTSHAEIGAYLLGLWGFNHEQMGGVHWHQTFVPDLGTTPDLQFIVRVANAFDHELVRIHDGYAQRGLDFPPDVFETLEPRLASWRETCLSSLLQDCGAKSDVR